MTCGYIKIKISAVQRELQKGSNMGVFIKCDVGFYKRKSHYGRAYTVQPCSYSTVCDGYRGRFVIKGSQD